MITTRVHTHLRHSLEIIKHRPCSLPFPPTREKRKMKPQFALNLIDVESVDPFHKSINGPKPTNQHKKNTAKPLNNTDNSKTVEMFI